MTLYRTVLLTSCLVLSLCGAAQAQTGAQGSSSGAAGKTVTLKMPALPDPVGVTLDPKATALLVLDYVDPICSAQPKCEGGMLPALTAFMAKAREAGVIVAYGTREQTMSKWLPPIAPAPGDIKIESTAQDRFFSTNLEQELKGKNITTIVMAGWKVNGSVTYTSVGATVRDFTVVVPVDTTAAATDYETVIGFYQILNQSNGNLTNEPLKPRAATLSHTDLITFK
ncbi:MAG TPA: isochorismatase family protein [Alphaproteobacteria bacterium]|jgi:nicotinamidase-related amidase|nr:isochorismatase family protein [Alphaproteobacteria bacterium]